MVIVQLKAADDNTPISRDPREATCTVLLLVTHPSVARFTRLQLSSKALAQSHGGPTHPLPGY